MAGRVMIAIGASLFLGLGDRRIGKGPADSSALHLTGFRKGTPGPCLIIVLLTADTTILLGRDADSAPECVTQVLCRVEARTGGKVRNRAVCCLQEQLELINPSSEQLRADTGPKVLAQARSRR